MLGKHLIKSWASTQASISLSSGEAEFYGVVKAAGVGLGYTSLSADVGSQLPLRVWTDSTATIGICGRQGLGKLRHIDTQFLWIQHRVRDGTFSLMKVRGKDNPADLFTKHLVGSERATKLLELFGCSFQDGRAQSALTLRAGKGTNKGELLSSEGTQQERWADMRDSIQWNGKTYPCAIDKDGLNTTLPDAYPTYDATLPHMHPNIDNHFPTATVCPALPEDKQEEDEVLEAVGRSEGINGGREERSGERGGVRSIEGKDSEETVASVKKVKFNDVVESRSEMKSKEAGHLRYLEEVAPAGTLKESVLGGLPVVSQSSVRSCRDMCACEHVVPLRPCNTHCGCDRLTMSACESRPRRCESVV